MSKVKDLTGQKFGRLTVLKQVERPNDRKDRSIYWLCKCNCEDKNERIYSSGNLRSGNTKSCGCLRSDSTIEYNNNRKTYNTYDLTGEYGIGYTNNTDEQFFFDLEDYNLIKDYHWFKYRGYIFSNDKDNKMIALHRLVMNFPTTEATDHLNRNKLDNRKDNLLPTTAQTNLRNLDLRSTNTSGITGVTWSKQKDKWHSYIMSDKKLIHLGFFLDKEDAIFARLKAEKENGYSGANVKLWAEYGII